MQTIPDQSDPSTPLRLGDHRSNASMNQPETLHSVKQLGTEAVDSKTALFMEKNSLYAQQLKEFVGKTLHKMSKGFTSPATYLVVAAVISSIKFGRIIQEEFNKFSIPEKLHGPFRSSLSVEFFFSSITLATVPFKLTSISSNFYNVIHEAQAYVRGIQLPKGAQQSARHLIDAGLLALASFGDLIDIPASVAYIVNVFHPVAQLPIWGGALGLASSVFSIGGIIYTYRQHQETRELMDTLMETSNQAFLRHLKICLEKQADDPCKAALQIEEFKEILTQESEKAFNLLLDHKYDPKDLQKIVDSVRSQASKFPEAEDFLAELEGVGQRAYLDCLRMSDDHFLAKHFEVKGKVIKSALKAIGPQSSPTDLKQVHGILKGRLHLRLDDLKANMIIDTISAVASIVLTIAFMCTAASPAAPAVYAILTAIAIFVAAKFFINRWYTKQAEEDLKEIAQPRVAVLPGQFEVNQMIFEKRRKRASLG